MPFPQLRRLAFRVLTPGVTDAVMAQVPPGPGASINTLVGALAGALTPPVPPLILSHLNPSSVASGQPQMSGVTLLPVVDGTPARMVIVAKYAGESFLRGGAFALAYHPGMILAAPAYPAWHDVWSDWNTSSLLLHKDGSHGLKITKVPVGWYDRLHTHPSDHGRERKRPRRYVPVAREARKAAKRQARYTARYGQITKARLPPHGSSYEYLATRYDPPPDHEPEGFTHQLRGSGTHRIPFNTDSGYIDTSVPMPDAFTQSIDPKTGGPWSGPTKFRHRATQGGQGPYNPFPQGFSSRPSPTIPRIYQGGIYASGGRRPGIYGQDEAPESDGPSLMSIGVAGALGWLVGRL